MQSLVSRALSVPDIQQAIFGYHDLSLNDKARWMLVNRIWAAAIRPFLWYFFDDINYWRPQQRKRTLTQQEFLENANWIRYLVAKKGMIVTWLPKVDRKIKSRWLGLDLRQDCTSNRDAQGYCRGIDAMTIIHGCDRLKFLALEGFDLQQDQLFSEYDPLTWPHHLQELTLTKIDLTWQAIELLKKFCPKLVSLKLVDLSLHHQSPESSLTEMDFYDHKEQNWSSIRKLDMSSHGDHKSLTTEYLLGDLILGQCHDLEILTLTRSTHKTDQIFIEGIIKALSRRNRSNHQSHQSCAPLSRLELYNFRTNKSVDDMVRILSTFQTFPKSLYIQNFNFRLASEIILRDPYRLSTLESIKFCQCDFMDSTTVLKILENSPRLKFFKMDDDTCPALLTLALKDYNTTTNGWMCSDLEVLDCQCYTIAIEDRLMNPKSLNSEGGQEEFAFYQRTRIVEQSQKAYDRLFNQLKKLHRLKYLRIGIELACYVEAEDYEISLKTFLKDLTVDGKSTIEKIDIRAFFFTKNSFTEVSHTIIPSANVDWCLSTWPRVEVVEDEHRMVDWKDDKGGKVCDHRLLYDNEP